jgi:hypothetical protein
MPPLNGTTTASIAGEVAGDTEIIKCIKQVLQLTGVEAPDHQHTKAGAPVGLWRCARPALATVWLSFQAVNEQAKEERGGSPCITPISAGNASPRVPVRRTCMHAL